MIPEPDPGKRAPDRKLLRRSAAFLTFTTAIFFCLQSGFLLQPADAFSGGLPHQVAIIYIEANSGDSSGGHAALKLGTEIFHYQFSRSGRLHLEREGWEDFRFFYNDLGNRTLHEARLTLPPPVNDHIWRYFTRRLLEQENSLARLRELENEMQLLRELARPHPRPTLRCNGFFQTANGSGGRPALRLRQEIEKKLGNTFLTRLSHRLGDELSHLPTPEPQTAVIAGLRIYREKLALWNAVINLQYCRGLTPSALVSLPTPKQSKKTFLPPAERTALKQQIESFCREIIKLLRSPRPDRGFALLLATARRLALEKSLIENRFLILDARPETEDCEIVDALEQAGSPRNLDALAVAADQRLIRQRRRFVSSRNPGEIGWSQIENSAARSVELRACAQGQRMMRVYSGIRLPDRPGPLSLPRPPDKARAAALLPVIRQELDKRSAALDHRSAYNLFTRNCVTELFADLARSLPPATKTGKAANSLSEQQQKLLEQVSFVPWRMFAQVKKNLHPVEIICYPSFRERVLADLYRRQNPLKIYCRECNTLTSTIYATGRDRSFLFFTDDTLLARPFYGVINLTWALAQTSLGLLNWPFDHGRLLSHGVHGAIFSLPEIFFVNLRKGDFAYLPTIR